MLVSHLLWLVQRALHGRARAAAHLGICALAAAVTTAPFTAALLMPDLFAPVVALALLLLGLWRDALSRAEALWLGAIAAVGIAAHLSHLPLALAMVGLVLLAAGWRGALRAALPLAAAILLLLATNAWGHGRAALSPHGATFLLARLQADGPATQVIRRHCPGSGWYLCAFLDRLPMPSDDFLWAPDSPVNRDPGGRPRFLGGALISPEAEEIVRATLREEPLGVARAMLANTLAQIASFAIGDTLGSRNLAAALRPRIAESFPARELAAFDAARQSRDALAPLIAWLIPLHVAAVALALPVLAIAAWREGESRRRWFILGLFVAVAANALATGGLSGVFPRYQARIVWLLPVMAALMLPATRPRPR
jgi:hypothetical protein